MKQIHLAGGCFWGVEHYFRNIEGVIETEVGYANGRTPDPIYEQVYTDTTGYAETVRVIYDPLRLPLEELLRDYFCAIDPFSLNKQGPDEGTRYRTGIYYSDEEDLPVIRKVCDEVGDNLAVEVAPLENFYTAEGRHQDYLVKNPDGYCHLPLKLMRYPKLVSDLHVLLEDEPDEVARMANAAALLKERMGFFWAGFYIVKEALPNPFDPDSADDPEEREELVLGPFQGPSACMRIGYGKGVCGTAWKEGRTIVVPDVEAFPGHIACSSLSRSEIIVPLFDPYGAVMGVLDIDSTEPSAFDHTDAHWLERFAAVIQDSPAAGGPKE